MKNHNFYDVVTLNRIILIRNSTVSNVFKMLSTKITFPSSDIYIIIFLQELLPFVQIKFAIICDVASITQVISNKT